MTGPASGTLSLLADGSFGYTPNPDFHGTDSFTYRAFDGSAFSNVATVTLVVSPINDPPVAVDDAYATDEDVVLNVAAPGVLGNDTDVDGDPLTAIQVTGPANGTLSLLPDGSFGYTPDPDFNGTDSFTYLANDGLLDSNVATVTITVNATFSLTVTKAGTGSGVVTSTPLGIDCGIDCTEVYGSGTVVTLTAAADVGSTFAGWSGDCDAAGSVTMTADRACTATFTLDVHTLTVTKAGTGTGTVTSVPLGIDCGIDCTEPYDFGTAVTLTATADVGSTFAGWSGDCDAAGSVTMTADRACTATFTLDVHTLTVTKAGTGSGTVTSTPVGIDCGHRLHGALRLRHGGDADSDCRCGLDVCRLERRLRCGRVGHDDGGPGLHGELHARCPHPYRDKGRNRHGYGDKQPAGHRLRQPTAPSPTTSARWWR